MTTYTNLHITTPLHCLAIGFLLHQTLFRRLALETNASTISIQAFIGKVEMISRTRVLGAADVMWKHAYQTLHRSKLLFAILWCASLCAKIFPKFFSRRTDQKQKCSLREVPRNPTPQPQRSCTSALCLHNSSQPIEFIVLHR